MYRDYRYGQTFGFVQDSIRITSRLLLHLGVRYDWFGPPRNFASTSDWLLALGPGSDFTQRLATAQLVPLERGQRLYSADNNDWAPRVGFAWNLTERGDFTLRGAYGIYYDRPFDNLWLNLRFNNILPVTADYSENAAPQSTYNTNTLAAVATNNRLFPSYMDFGLTLYQPGIQHAVRTGVTFYQSNEELSESALLEFYYGGAQGRKLITTDLVNRSTCTDGQDSCRPNPGLRTDVDYRANPGSFLL